MTQPEKRTFVSDLAWNYVSLVFLALGGFLFSFVIITFYDASTLGVFNQVYAYYLLLSQVAVLGVHMSVIKYVPEFTRGGVEQKTIFAVALGAALLLSLAADLLLAVALLLTGAFIASPVLDGMWTLLPALPFFSLNKVILNYLNARRDMKAYAVFQSLRNIFIALALLGLALASAPGPWLCACFAIAEILLFAVSILYLAAKRLLGFSQAFAPGWFAKHLKFGFRILPGNLILEFNAKIDIICLGLVLQNNTIVGYYSFASLFTEGFYQIFVVVRRNINPLLAQYSVLPAFREKFAALRDRMKKILWAASLPAAALLVAGYYVLCLLLRDNGYLSALVPLAVIAGSIALNSRSVVLGNLLAQTGYPGKESVVNICAAATNFLLNLVFIYFWGMLGAAVATAISYFVFSFLLRFFSKRLLGVRM